MENIQEIIDDFNSKNKDFQIFKEDNILKLKSLKNKEWLPFFIDFSSNDITRRLKQINNKQDIAKTVGVKGNFKPRILDTTAGQGRDAFLLASLGCNITMLERNPVIFLLLSNAIENAKIKNPEIKNIFNNMNLINVNSIDFLKNNNEDFDVIYIDPMFPKSKKSRLVKKDMQIFKEIVGDDFDGAEILNHSLKTKIKRIVVKRMLKSELLTDKKPDFNIKGDVIRYDVYMNILH